ncbi:glycosyltransferase family 4 protein [Candidatus Woesearchaeota archaeon]|nr:glycosyltransferase family 4 protein [Candidatus Woesearchaeota archaeon]MBW3016302.1 glycosyltransferase family 4 protein [Candidatus Woesearchaeota archaeon]
MSKLKVLMFGWEFPPYKSGGLGTACYGLTKALSKQNVEVTFVMPVTPEGAKAKFVKLIGASNIAKNVKIKTIDSPLKAYMTSASYEEQYYTWGSNKKQVYGKDLYQEVQRYAQIAKHIAKTEPHDIIHCHDWMTYQAGINAKKASKKPLIMHLHATEFDRTADNPDHRISHIEWQGLDQADIIITNSHFSKKNIIKHYKIHPDKIQVVHWGIDEAPTMNYKPEKKDKTVLFLGRVTIQKGPDYFIEVAKKVLEHEPNTKFVIVGDGDMLPRMINRTAELGITDKVIFTGALSGEDVHKAFQTADLYVMPSVSEPFGLVALESLKNRTPVLISKQSGVSEVLKNALKTDFWDLNKMTDMIVNVLRHTALQEELKEHGTREAQKFNLDEPARKIKEVYQRIK